MKIELSCLIDDQTEARFEIQSSALCWTARRWSGSRFKSIGDYSSLAGACHALLHYGLRTFPGEIDAVLKAVCALKTEIETTVGKPINQVLSVARSPPRERVQEADTEDSK